MSKKSAIELSASFIVILIICIAVFGFSIYIVKKFFTHAENIKMTYDERTEKEIERLLDDGSKIAIPFDKKTIYNGKFDAFGIGILNVLNTGESNEFKIDVTFDKAYNKNAKICELSSASSCGYPHTWLQTTEGSGGTITKIIKNNEQVKFLLGVSPKNAPSGIYIFNVDVKYKDGANLIVYDATHKLYVDVP